jgi:hypothetical protein
MVWVVTITFLFIFICLPVAKLWYPQLPGKCINQVATWIANAASTILTDLIILLMPLPPLWSLHLAKREKIGLTAAFGLGSLYVLADHPNLLIDGLADHISSVVFASAYRTSVLFTYTATDPSYTLAPTVGWTAIEMAAGIISANLPTMLPALNVFLRMLGIRSKDGSSRSGSSNPFRSKGDRSNTTSQLDVDGAVPPPTGKRASHTVFYRLPDENDSTRSGREQGGLRPDVKAYQYTVESLSHGERDEGSGDEIPLHGIRVDKDTTVMERSSARPVR